MKYVLILIMATTSTPVTVPGYYQSLESCQRAGRASRLTWAKGDMPLQNVVDFTQFICTPVDSTR